MAKTTTLEELTLEIEELEERTAPNAIWGD